MSNNSEKLNLDVSTMPTIFDILNPTMLVTIDQNEQYIMEYTIEDMDNADNDYFHEGVLLDHNYAYKSSYAHIDKADKLSVINNSCIAITNIDTNTQTMINLPKMWSVTELTDDSQYFTHINLKLYEDNAATFPYVDKCLLIDKNRNIQYFIHNKLVLLLTKRCPSVLYDLKSLTHILSHFENHRVCRGFSLGENINIDSGKCYKDIFNVWRDNQCTLLTTSKYCTFCGKLVQKLSHNQKNGNEASSQLKRGDKRRLLVLRKKLARERRLKQKANLHIETLTQSLNVLQEELASNKNRSIIAQCAELGVKENEILAISEMVSAASKNDNTGHRYSAEWLHLSMQMSMRSSAVYNFLRDLRVLPLPCMKTVNKYASSLVAKSGLDVSNSTIVAVLNDVEVENENCVIDEVVSSMEIVK